MSTEEQVTSKKFHSAEVKRTSDFKSTWKKAPRTWGHSLHTLSPYVGGFPPSLAHYFIRKYSKVGDTVLDPFCGGGTTPFEAALHNRNALGNDAFSYAYTLTYAKCNPVNDLDLRTHLTAKTIVANSISNRDMSLLEDDDLRAFFSDYTLDQLLRLREALDGDNSDEGIYIKSLVCGILHGPSDSFLSIQTKDTYSGTASYVKKYAEEHGLEKPERDIFPRIIRKHDRVIADYIPPWISDRTTITQSDARNLEFEDGVADLILTSPPYMAVLDYTWNNWLRLWWLKKERQLERGKLDLTMDVDRYRIFIRECLQEMYRVLAEDSIAVLVVGDVKKHLSNGKQMLNTAGYIAEEAIEHTGFGVHGIVEDAYKANGNGYMVFNRLKYDYTQNGNGTKPKKAIDRCLILCKGNPQLSNDLEIDWELELYKE